MRFSQFSGKYVKFAVYLTIVVLLNLVGLTLFFRMDLTANKVYSISDASRQVVATLSEPLTINVFFTKNLPAPHNNTERYLHDLLEEYSYHANQFFNYRFYDVNPDEGDVSPETKRNQDLAKDYGIFPVQIQAIEKDEVKFMKAYMGLVLIHGDIIEKVPNILNTDGLEYTLTTAIQKLNNKVSALLALPEKVKVKLFLSSSLNQVAPFMGLNQLPEVPARIERIVQSANEKTYGKLDYRFFDPSRDPSLENAAQSYQILQLNWPSLQKNNIAAGKGYAGLVMEYQQKAVNIPLIQVFKIPIIGTQYKLANLDQMETIINSSLEALIDINQDLGLLSGFGSVDLTGTGAPTPPGQQAGGPQQSFNKLASQNYSIKAIDLSEEGLPDSLQCLVLPGPTEALSDHDLFLIDQFLMQGKSLAIFLDAFKEVMPDQQQRMNMGMQGPTYLPLKTGLEKLLNHYGISINQSLVMDENCYKQTMGAQFGGGERPIYFAPLIRNKNINNDLAFMQNIKGLIAVKLSPLTLDLNRIKANDLKATQIFSSSEKSWEMKGRINLNPMFIRPPQTGEKQKSFPLAYLIEGSFPSYFTGKPIPEKIVEADDPQKTLPSGDAEEPATGELSKIKDQRPFVAQGQPGKIFLLASTEMIKDNVIDAQGRNPNDMFIMNIIDYLNGREEVAVMRSKSQRFNPLDDTHAGTKTFVKTFNIAGLPILVVFFGLGVWLRRHSRKKRIQAMFQK